MERTTMASLLAALLLAAGCDDGSVRRHITLSFQPDSLPQAQSVFVGDGLRVQVDRIEALRINNALVAWARQYSAWVWMGVVTTGTPATFVAQPLGLKWTDVTKVQITQEASTEPLEEPSTVVHFAGQPGGMMTIGSGEAIGQASFAGASAHAVAEDNTLVLTYSGLPALGAGRYYAAWLLPQGLNVGGTSSGGGDGHAHGHLTVAQPVLLGRLGTSGSDTFSVADLVATYAEVAITLELENGTAAAALLNMVMRGPIPTQAATAGAETVAHEH